MCNHWMSVVSDGFELPNVNAPADALAKKSGLWHRPDRPSISFVVPKELERALAKNTEAKSFFDQLAASYQRQFIGWIAVAKRQETGERRVKESIAPLEQSEKLGMKWMKIKQFQSDLVLCQNSAGFSYV